MPDLSLIKKPLPEQAEEVILDLAVQVEVEPDVAPEPDPDQVAADPTVDEPAPTLLPEERRNLLQDEPRERLTEKLIECFTDDDLLAMPVVSEHPRAREHRLDWEAAALGAPVEVEREEAAVAICEAENVSSPSREEVDALYAAPRREATVEPDTSVASEWIVDESLTPTTVDSTADDVTDQGELTPGG